MLDLEKRLNKLDINSVYDLAHTHPSKLKKEFGVLGVQLFFHVNGIDESSIHDKFNPKSKSISNSQTLPRDYVLQKEIELVISELAEQVAIRLRKEKKKTSLVSLYVGFSFSETQKSIHVQSSIDPTNSTLKLKNAILKLFQEKYTSGSGRRIGIWYGHLCDDNFEVISLFEDDKLTKNQEIIQGTIDEIRDTFGFLSIQKANVLSSGSRAIARSKLVGGHSAGGLDGLT